MKAFYFSFTCILLFFYFSCDFPPFFVIFSITYGCDVKNGEKAMQAVVAEEPVVLWAQLRPAIVRLVRAFCEFGWCCCGSCVFCSWIFGSSWPARASGSKRNEV